MPMVVGIYATLKTIDVYKRIVNKQETCEENIEDYALRMQAGEEPPPILVVAMKKGNYILDGFHRVYSARLAAKQFLQAWVIKEKDFDELIDKEFRGIIPFMLADLDDYIDCNGRTYFRPYTDGPGCREDF